MFFNSHKLKYTRTLVLWSSFLPLGIVSLVAHVGFVGQHEKTLIHLTDYSDPPSALLVERAVMSGTRRRTRRHSADHTVPFTLAWHSALPSPQPASPWQKYQPISGSCGRQRCERIKLLKARAWLHLPSTHLELFILAEAISQCRLSTVLVSKRSWVKGSPTSPTLHTPHSFPLTPTPLQPSFWLLRSQILTQDLWLLSKLNCLQCLVNMGQIKLQKILRNSEICAAHFLSPQKCVGRGEEHTGMVCTHTCSRLFWPLSVSLISWD